MAEQAAHNRWVLGSNPSGPIQVIKACAKAQAFFVGVSSSKKSPIPIFRVTLCSI